MRDAPIVSALMALHSITIVAVCMYEWDLPLYSRARSPALQRLCLLNLIVYSVHCVRVVLKPRIQWELLIHHLCAVWCMLFFYLSDQGYTYYQKFSPTEFATALFYISSAVPERFRSTAGFLKLQAVSSSTMVLLYSRAVIVLTSLPNSYAPDALGVFSLQRSHQIGVVLIVSVLALWIYRALHALSFSVALLLHK